MITVQSRNQFMGSIIAQHDDADYSESGYVAIVRGNDAALTSYGHCSCYDTWESISGGSDYYDTADIQRDIRLDWVGTVDELIALAQRKADPNIPGRTADPNDCDYDHLMAVYDQIIEWDKAGRKAPVPV